MLKPAGLVISIYILLLMYSIDQYMLCNYHCYIGCGKCWSMDGNWKLMFPHCMYYCAGTASTQLSRCLPEPAINLTASTITQLPLRGHLFICRPCGHIEFSQPVYRNIRV